MKKSYIIFTILLFMVVGYAAMQVRMNVKGRTSLSENLDDFNVYLANLKLNNTEIEGINETKDGYVISIPSKGTIEYDIVNDSTEYDVETSVECEETTEQKTWDFDYTGSEQTFTVPKDGTYKLETWGAQGGSSNTVYIGGYGGYTIGEVVLSSNKKIYIEVDGNGETNSTAFSNTGAKGGYNGGGMATPNSEVNHLYGAGGGATHIALSSGLLSTFENNQDDLLIVSGGGGGGRWQSNYAAGRYGYGGSGGGYKGVTAYDIASKSNIYGGTQEGPTEGGINGSFGQGGESSAQGAGGGGYYGGNAGGPGGGGSGYIGNSLLTEKSMYCYNCEESTEESTKTISTTCVNEEPTENCAKKGNGYARITSNPQVQTTQLAATTIEAQEKISNKVEVENNGMKCNLKIKKISRTEKKVYTGPTEWTFDYTGGEQTFTIPVSGTYKLETWGAQGGGYSNYIGGYGSFSFGKIELDNGDNLYINVGGKGKTGSLSTSSVIINGGYNGGGSNSSAQYGHGSSSGGATHIATTSGLLSTLEKEKDNILIVSGGGGGGGQETEYIGYCYGGSAGGIIGSTGSTNPNRYTNPGSGGTQTTGYSFGKGENSNSWIGAGGGGFFGGYKGCGGGGGSSYIGNPLLSEKSMYCYNCEESTEESTKTISTTCVNETPTTNCAKSGNGYARITLIK